MEPARPEARGARERGGRGPGAGGGVPDETPQARHETPGAGRVGRRHDDAGADRGGGGAAGEEDDVAERRHQVAVEIQPGPEGVDHRPERGLVARHQVVAHHPLGRGIGGVEPVTHSPVRAPGPSRRRLARDAVHELPGRIGAPGGEDRGHGPGGAGGRDDDHGDAPSQPRRHVVGVAHVASGAIAQQGPVHELLEVCTRVGHPEHRATDPVDRLRLLALGADRRYQVHDAVRRGDPRGVGVLVAAGPAAGGGCRQGDGGDRGAGARQAPREGRCPREGGQRALGSRARIVRSPPVSRRGFEALGCNFGCSRRACKASCRRRPPAHRRSDGAEIPATGRFCPPRGGRYSARWVARCDMCCKVG